MEIDTSNMVKGKYYCCKCLKEVKLNKENNKIIYDCDCYKGKSNIYYMAWCDNCNKFTSRRGPIFSNKCNREFLNKTINSKQSKDKIHKYKLENGIYEKQIQNIHSKKSREKALETLKSKNHFEKLHSKEIIDKIVETNTKNGHFEKLHSGEIRNKITKTQRENGHYKRMNAASHTNQAEVLRQKVRKESGALDYWIEIVAKNSYTKTIYCEKCNKETIHNGKRCYKCDPPLIWEFSGLKILYCNKCDKDTLHNNKICSVCNPGIISSPVFFDRDSFYASDLNLVSFKVNGDSDQNMSLSKFVDKYNKVGSVIARNLYSSDDCFICCLDVAKTNGTSGELSWFQRTMKTAKEQRNLSEEELSKLSNPSIRLKRRKYLEEMDKHQGSKIVSEVVFAFDYPVGTNSEEEKYLLNVERQYAHDSKALFWSY